MSTLTEEQKWRMDENRRKALAMRNARLGAAKSAPQVTSQVPPRPTVNYPPSSTSVIRPPAMTSSNHPIQAQCHGNPGGLPRQPQRFINTGAANKSTTNSNTGSFLPFKSTQTLPNKPVDSFENRPKEKSFTTQEVLNQVVSPHSKVSPLSRVKGTCVLTSRERFLVDVGYCAPLIMLFKTMPTKLYDMETKKWSFELKDYQNLMTKLKDLSDTVLLEPLPRCVLTTFSFSLQGKPQSNEIPETDLSKVDQSLVHNLMPFQATGIRFGISKGGRVLVADDMGLGKTIQGLGIAAYYRKEWPLLIVSPSSVRFAWREQILKWLSSVDPQEVNVVTTAKEGCVNCLVNILSYDLMVRLQKDLLDKHFRVIIMDESHCLKNIKTARTKAALPLLKKASRVILLSGTPALSRPSELFTQVSAVSPRVFSQFHDFGVRYCEGKKNPWGWDFSGSSNMGELQLVLEESVMIRRLKKHVLKQLPAKMRQMVILDPSLVKIGKNMKDSQKLVDKAKAVDRRGALLEYFNETGSSKILAVREYILELLEASEKFLVFAHHQSVLNSLEEAVQKKNCEYIRIDGHTGVEQRNILCTRFQRSDSVRLALLSITAANAGINLTAASLVVFAELFWNPGILVQAEDRAHRIGQQDSVSIHYLVAKGTADDYIWPLVQDKLAVLSKAGLSKEDFTEADTKQMEDPKQKTILSYFETSFFDEEVPDGLLVAAGGPYDETFPERETASTSGHSEQRSLFQYFQPTPKSSSDTKNPPTPDTHEGTHLSNQDEVLGKPDSDWLDENRL